MGLRDEALLGSTVHSFDESPNEEWTGKAAMIFVPEGGATISAIYVEGGDTNVIADFTNTSSLKAGVTLADSQGRVISRVVGSAGQINIVKG
jgi:hypothetical protein